MATEREQRLEPAFDRAEVGLGELGDRALHGLVVGDLGQRVAAPQTDRLVERGEGGLRVALPQLLATPFGEQAQPDGVHRLARDVQAVALGPGGQRPAQPSCPPRAWRRFET